MIQLIATIKLDTLAAAGTVRGVLAWDTEHFEILCLDPRVSYVSGIDADSVSDIPVRSLDEAMQAIRDGWGADGGETWGLEWLCEDPGDYDRS